MSLIIFVFVFVEGVIIYAPMDTYGQGLQMKLKNTVLSDSKEISQNATGSRAVTKAIYRKPQGVITANTDGEALSAGTFPHEAELYTGSVSG